MLIGRLTPATDKVPNADPLAADAFKGFEADLKTFVGAGLAAILNAFVLKTFVGAGAVAAVVVVAVVVTVTVEGLFKVREAGVDDLSSASVLVSGGVAELEGGVVEGVPFAFSLSTGFFREKENLTFSPSFSFNSIGGGVEDPESPSSDSASAAARSICSLIN
jgi:hypothetical protein